MTRHGTRAIVGVIGAALVVGTVPLGPAKLATTAIGVALLVAVVVGIAWLLLRSIPDEQARASVRRAFYVGLAIRLVAAPTFYVILLAAAWNGPGLFWDDEKFFTAFAE
jgi:hypothetical protein